MEFLNIPGCVEMFQWVLKFLSYELRYALNLIILIKHTDVMKNDLTELNKE